MLAPSAHLDMPILGRGFGTCSASESGTGGVIDDAMTLAVS
jgi:hypothetical protein